MVQRFVFFFVKQNIQNALRNARRKTAAIVIPLDVQFHLIKLIRIIRAEKSAVFI